ncbi:cell division protein FtsZ [Dongia sedimenti]|uniref:Cell division protein FtsZ n=1 Tax=Dongia sedimenti TaxID=3064282 RepID=A0ABU0YEG6_9PROT|nr:cell division protein FtsZ [Rhodospirillaceae bacterium R-7]
MALNLSIPSDPFDIRPRITVIGVGGAGGNAVNNMIRAQLEGVEFLIANTDAQALQGSMCERRIQLGQSATKGLGAGARPDVGRVAAEEAVREIADQLAGSNMAFITAGMGGGTGTGAAPVVAQIAREQGILTVGVVTKPFHFEGAHRMRLAESGIQELQQYVDTLIIIPNQNLFRVANEKTTFADAFKMADEVLYSGVRGVTDLMVMPGLINLDFADIRAVMGEMGKAMMGTGEATGENRAIAAAEAAISNPLLDEVSMKGARGVLINITGGMDMTLFEVDEAANRIRDEVDPEANIIFGSTFDQSLDGKIRISVVATGIEAVAQQQRPTQTGGVNLSVIASNPAPQPAAYTAPNLSTVAEDRGFARMEAARMDAPQAPMPTYQSAPIVAQAQAAQTVAQAAAPRPMPAQGNASMGMTTSSIGATALQAQPARPPMVKDEMAHLQRATTVARQAERPVDDRPFIAPQAMEAGRGQLQQGEPARRGASLFEKMTSRLTGQPLPAQPAAQPSRMQAPAAQAPRVQVREPQRVEQPAAQPMLNLDPNDRIAAPRAEEDLLDIPAFLRRQAN